MKKQGIPVKMFMNSMEYTKENVSWLRQQLFSPRDSQLLTIEFFQQADHIRTDASIYLILPHVEEQTDDLRYLTPGFSGAGVLLIVPKQKGKPAKVVKFGDSKIIDREFEAYRQHIENRFPKNFRPEIIGKKVAAGQYSSFAYTWAGGEEPVLQLRRAFGNEHVSAEELGSACKRLMGHVFKWYTITSSNKLPFDSFDWGHFEGEDDRAAIKRTLEKAQGRNAGLSDLSPLHSFMEGNVSWRSQFSPRGCSEAEYCHGDINCHNVVVSQTPQRAYRAKLIDFGNVRSKTSPAYDWARLERDVKLLCLRDHIDSKKFARRLKWLTETLGRGFSQAPPPDVRTKKIADFVLSLRKRYLDLTKQIRMAGTEYQCFLLYWNLKYLCTPYYQNDDDKAQNAIIECALNTYHCIEQCISQEFKNNLGKLPKRRIEFSPTSENVNEEQRSVSLSGALDDSALTSPWRPFPAIWGVPFPQMKNFFGRESLIGKIRQIFEAGQERIQVLSGPSGIGKTQLAVEYAFRYRHFYEAIWWIRGPYPSVMSWDCDAFFKEIENTFVSKKSAYKNARHWLRRNRKSLVICDDVLSPAEFDRQFHDLGHVVVTSQNPSWLGVGTVHEIKCLAPEEAIDFLVSRSGRNDRAGAATVAAELQYHPMALEQAAAYMEVYAMSCPDYLKRLQKEKPKYLWNFTEFRSLSAALTNSMTRAAFQSEAAGLLIRFFAYFSSDPIPLDVCVDKFFARENIRGIPGVIFRLARLFNKLWTKLMTLDWHASPQSLFNQSVRDGVATLRKFSLVQTDGEFFSFHGLVQEYARSRPTLINRRKMVILMSMVVHFHVGADDPKRLRYWLPHVQALLNHAKTLGIQDPIFGYLAVDEVFIRSRLRL